MRENSRRTIARAKSRRATARELRDARIRLKEIEQEFRDIPLLDETKRGEDRDARYARVLKLRAMREEFEQYHPYDKRPHANSLMLSLVLVVASFVFCAAVGLIAVGSYRFFTNKPDPVATAANFWTDMEALQYADAHATYFSPTLRVQQRQDLFVTQAKQADSDFGAITAAALASQQVDPTTATLTYHVTRTLSGKATTYDTTLSLQLFQGAWGISDLGATIDPTQAVNGPPAPSASPSVSPSPSATPKK